MKYENLEEKTVSSQSLYDGVIVHLYKDDVTLPNGNPAIREVVRLIGAVAVVPVTDDGKVIMEKQYRYPMNQVVTEIPAGKLDSKAEDPLEAAKRELREETGYTADEWISMGNYVPSPAYCDEVIGLYLAKGLHIGAQDLDEDEFLNVEMVPLGDLIEEVMKGNITDGKTQVGLLKAALLLNQ